MSHVALITGITGQDGAYLTRLLLGKGYTVYGTYRRTSSVNFWRLEELGCDKHPNLHLVEYDLTDLGTNARLIDRAGITEVYNLAASRQTQRSAFSSALRSASPMRIMKSK